jgi:hypothetical protein
VYFETWGVGFVVPRALPAIGHRAAKQIVNWMGESFPTGVATSRFFLEMRTRVKINTATAYLFPQRVSRPPSAQHPWFR